MKKTLYVLLFFLIASLCNAQVYVPGDHNNWDLDSGNEATLKTNLGGNVYYGKTITPSSNQQFKIVFGGNWDIVWGAGFWIPGSGNFNAAWEIASGGNNAQWNGDNIGQMKNHVHLCIKDPGGSTGGNLSVGIMTLSAEPVEFSTLNQVASIVEGGALIIDGSLANTPNAEEHFYVRYSSDGFSTSAIQELSVTGTTFSTEITNLSVGTVEYYLLSSTLDQTTLSSESDIDLMTINYLNNGGSNYTTSIEAYQRATISPENPERDDSFTISFDAAGTNLEDVAKVYLHSGVSTDVSNATAFTRTVGNWGADDGVGEMTLKEGTTNTWEITIASAESFYGVLDTEDVFGLNFLFRSADGSQTDDGTDNANYHESMNPGNFYFTIDDPLSSPTLISNGSSFTVSATADQSLNWTLQETDANFTNGTEVNSATSNASYLHTVSVNDNNYHYYQLSGEYSGETKTKTFVVKGYPEVIDETRPASVEAGINYNTTDPSQVTLVLHTPTATSFKDGNGNTTGTNTTTPKSVVYAIGSFNNWVVDDNYIMKRDGDYWWITLENLTPGQEYIFQYLIDGELRIADPYTHKVSDQDDKYITSSTYPELITYPSDFTSEIASTFQTNQVEYSWEVTNFTRPASNQLNIYELHFRDFTDEGTFKAATEKLDYIDDLGINCIHVMPVSEFEGNDSWGYNPNFYFALDKAYGTANDFKKFVDEAHKRGIAVVNDLVLNHAFYSNVMARMYWDDENNQPASNNPWFNSEHRAVYSESGHWGADWNHESEHTQAFMDQILDYWITEYKLDGYRFDFTKGISQQAPDAYDEWASNYNQSRIDLLKRLIGTMWTNHPGSYAILEHLAADAEDEVLADFGMLMWSGAGPQEAYFNLANGYTNSGNYSIWESVYESRNFDYANYVSYMESHDEERIAYDVSTYGNGVKDLSGDAKIEAMINRVKLVSAFNALLPGPRMLWQFEELGYDISIDYNGRTGRKPTAWDYYTNNDRKELYRLYSLIFNLRESYDLYSSKDYGNIGSTDLSTPRRMAYTDGSGNQVIVIANFSTTDGANVTPGYVATGTWYKYNGDADLDGSRYELGSTEDTYYLNPSEMVILTNIAPTANSDVVTVSAESIQGTTIDLSVDVSALENEYASVYGICWSKTSTIPDLEDEQMVVGTPSVQTASVQITELEQETKYYIRAYVQTGTEITYSSVFTATTANTWTGSVSSDWDDAENWTGTSVPSETTNVYIPNTTNEPIIGSAMNMMCNDITIDADATLIIESNATQSGSLIVKGTGSGDATYKRWVEHGNWHLFSSPVSSCSIDDFIQTNSTIAQNGNMFGVGVYLNNQSTPAWKNYTNDQGAYPASSHGDFVAGAGYEVLTTSDGVLEFTGSINTKSLSIPIHDGTGQGTGWNLIGNPYISPICIKGNHSVLTEISSKLDPARQAIYLWDPSRVEESKYEIVSELTSEDMAIAPGQAFFICAKSGESTLELTPDICTNDNVTLKSTLSNYTQLTLELRNEKALATTQIFFVDGATVDLDPGYDIGRINLSTEALSIYSQLSSESSDDEFAIQAVGNEGAPIIPLGITSTGHEQFELTLHALNLDSHDRIFIEDRLLGVLTELDGTPYVIDGATSGFGRYYLHKKSTTSNQLVGDLDHMITVTPQSKSNQIIVNSKGVVISAICIFGVDGSAITSEHGLSSHQHTIDASKLKSGVYIIRVQTTNGMESEKIMWK